MKIFSLILAENPLFFPDFPDWRKCSKFSLNSLMGGNPGQCCNNTSDAALVKDKGVAPALTPMLSVKGTLNKLNKARQDAVSKNMRQELYLDLDPHLCQSTQFFTLDFWFTRD